MNLAQVEAYTAERDAALKTLDMDYARRMMPNASDEVLLLGMHKARYEAVNIEDALRYESAIWLKERGYKRFAGLPWPKDGELPK